MNGSIRISFIVLHGSDLDGKILLAAFLDIREPPIPTAASALDVGGPSPFADAGILLAYLLHN